ncbi:hypothetical protein BDU57DRAFT_193917 [Ampelomyces quisqualis]|uniref:Uncharacterized protein n=1 Tax=Ampelomyces quisqualis TaxID=50730 RepID=A0A6A5QRB9_AMPQU|nr:hypothetical protein BDU57DRAFT_193917 [Ampelomyces quisqualis]
MKPLVELKILCAEEAWILSRGSMVQQTHYGSFPPTKELSNSLKIFCRLMLVEIGRYTTSVRRAPGQARAHASLHLHTRTTTDAPSPDFSQPEISHAHAIIRTPLSELHALLSSSYPHSVAISTLIASIKKTTIHGDECIEPERRPNARKSAYQLQCSRSNLQTHPAETHSLQVHSHQVATPRIQ